MQKIFRRQFLLGVCADMQPAVIHFVHIKRGGEEVRRWHAYFRKWLDVVCQQIWDRRQVLCTHSTQSTKIRHVPNKFQEPDELSTKSASPSASPHSIPGSCAWYQELNFFGGNAVWRWCFAHPVTPSDTRDNRPRPELKTTSWRDK